MACFVLNRVNRYRRGDSCDDYKAIQARIQYSCTFRNLSFLIGYLTTGLEEVLKFVQSLQKEIPIRYEVEEK